MNRFVYLLFVCIGLNCCQVRKVTIVPDEVHEICQKNLRDVIVHDIYSPPVASRIYAYCNLAYYEGIRYLDADAVSIVEQLSGFGKASIAIEKSNVDLGLVAADSFLKVAEALVFSKDSIAVARKKVEILFKNAVNDVTFERSHALADSIAKRILARASNDQYRQTRGMPRYSVFKEPGKWEQTPPDYADAVEPHWRLIKPLLMDSAGQYKPAPPPSYSLDPKSKYYAEVLEVYESSQQHNNVKDSIAYYWDDNPFVTGHQGHLMFATKKITPGGHWLGITLQLCKQKKLDHVQTARVLAVVSSAIFDGFISCWDEKYRSRTVRPVTVIRQLIDPTWTPFLQTPPFPEYTSGHSVVSSCAATVLSGLVGNELSFVDTTEMEYLGMRRAFHSVSQAADEAGVSRLYGGIHFRSAIEQGKIQGKKIGEAFLRLH